MKTVFYIIMLTPLVYSLKSNNDTSYYRDGYYMGIVFLKHVYLKIEKDTAVADFIFFNKGHRILLSDTLIYNKSKNMYLGKKSELTAQKNKYFIKVIAADSVSKFFYNESITLKENEKYYKQNINRDKNYAVLRYRFSNYIINQSDEYGARTKYHDISEKIKISEKAEKMPHELFLKEIDTLYNSL